MIIIIRIVVVSVSLGVWWWTQKLLGRRNGVVDTGDGARINDGIHRLTAKYNRYLNDNPKLANRLLIASSLVIDLLGLFLLFSAIFGESIQPFLGLMIVFGLRQICQGVCPLPAPVGMIWRDTGFPSLLVTYGTSSDFFFSGHTAIAVYGAATLASSFGVIGIVVGVGIAVFEIVTILVLRAHYTMDVFTGILAALYVQQIAIKISPYVDGTVHRLLNCGWVQRDFF